MSNETPIIRNKVAISVGDLSEKMSYALRKAGTTPEIAQLVTDRLIQEELQGHQSHGVFRIVDYVRAIEKGFIIPNAKPIFSRKTLNHLNVDGNGAFGMLVENALVAAVEEGEHSGPLLVSISESGHLGRLSNLLQRLGSKGFVVLSFTNYCGGGQRVAAPGCSEGRLCTNPIGFAFPTANSSALVMDMSTSVVAEGKIRQTLLDGQPPPPGTLYESNWQAASDPSLLYTTPPRAVMAPLGGENAGHKGFLLALAVEILAGILAGAGFASSAAHREGNGAFLLCFRPDDVGMSLQNFASSLETLVQYCESAPVEPGFQGFRRPRGATIQPLPKTTEMLQISLETYLILEQLL